MFDKIFGADGRTLSPQEIIGDESRGIKPLLSDEEIQDLNLIHKKWGGGRFMSMRLNSWISKKDGRRVTKVLLEFGITDKNDKLTECNSIYMDINKFTYFCEL